jgi:hypothetical protein
MNGSQFWELYQSYGDVYRQEVLSEEYEELDEVWGLGGEVHPTTGDYTGQGRKPNRTMGGVYNRSSSEKDYIDGGSRGRTGKGTLGAVGSAGMNRTPMAKAIEKRADLERTGQFKRANRITRGIDSMNKPIQHYNKGKAAGKAEGRKEMRGNVNASYEYDLYDVVLEHLLDEGFADTLEDAQVLMANMSEQWIDSIAEASEDSEVAGELARLRGQMRTAMQKGDDSAIQSISRRLAEIQPAARAKIGAEMRGLNKRKSSTVQEDSSTIKYYQGLLSDAQRVGDKPKAAKYSRMIDKIQQSVSQRG